MSLHALTGLWRSSPKQDSLIKKDAPAQWRGKGVALSKPTPPRVPLTPGYQKTLMAFASFTQIAQGLPPAPRAAAKATPGPGPDSLPKAPVNNKPGLNALVQLEVNSDSLKKFLPPSKSSIRTTDWPDILPIVISAAQNLRIAREDNASQRLLNELRVQIKNDICKLLAAAPPNPAGASLDDLQAAVEAMKTFGVEVTAISTELAERSADAREMAQDYIGEAWNALAEVPPNYTEMLQAMNIALNFHKDAVTATRLGQEGTGIKASTPLAINAENLSERTDEELTRLDKIFNDRLPHIEKALTLAGKHDTAGLLGQMRDAVKAARADKAVESNTLQPKPGSVARLLSPARDALEEVAPMQLTKNGDIHKGNASWNAQTALAGQLEALQKKAVQQHVDGAGIGMSQDMWDDMGRPNCVYHIQPSTGPAERLASRSDSSGKLDKVDTGDKNLRLAVSRFANHDAVRKCVGQLMESGENPITLNGKKGRFLGAEAMYGFTLGRAADGRVTVQCELLMSHIAGFQEAGAVNGSFVHLDPAKSHARFTYEVTVGADGSAELTRPLACEFRATPSAWQRNYPKPQSIADLLDPDANSEMRDAFKRSSLKLENDRPQRPNWGTTDALLSFHVAHAEFAKNPTLASARSLQRLYTNHGTGMERSVWEGLGKALNGPGSERLSQEQLLEYLRPTRDRVDELLQQRLDEFVAP